MKSKIISSWPQIEFYEIIKGKPRHGVYKPKEFFGKGTKIIKMGTHMKNNFITDDRIPDLIQLTENEIQRYQIFENDLLFLRTSLVMEGTGKCSIVKKLNQPMVFVSNIIAISLDNLKANSMFYYYYFSSKKGRNTILSLCEQTAAATVRSSDLINLKIPYPTFEIQNKISQMLLSLDEQIFLCKQQNKILKKTIRSIYKSWFIDFDGQIEFVDSELGEIPKGWMVKKIEEICDTYGGGTPSTKNSEYWNGDINWAIPSDLTKSNTFFLFETERKITKSGFDHCASKLHPKNSILMTSRATIGYFSINRVPVATNQGFIVIEPKKFNELYYLLNNFQERTSEFIEKANGTTFLEISRGTFRKLSILIPTEKLLNDFFQNVESIYNLIEKNEKEIQNLQTIRDSLLQKLFSGKDQI